MGSACLRWPMLARGGLPYMAIAARVLASNEIDMHASEAHGRARRAPLPAILPAPCIPVIMAADHHHC